MVLYKNYPCVSCLMHHLGLRVFFCETSVLMSQVLHPDEQLYSDLLMLSLILQNTVINYLLNKGWTFSPVQLDITLNTPLHFPCSYSSVRHTSAPWKHVSLSLWDPEDRCDVLKPLLHKALLSSPLTHCIFPYLDHLPGSMVSFHRLKSCRAYR